MSLRKYLGWINGSVRPRRSSARRITPQLTRLETRDVPAGYLAIGAGPGALAAVTIRVDIQDALGGSGPTTLGQPAVPRSDGKTDYTSETFYPFGTSFRGGVNVATGNFDGLYGTPDSLVTAAGPGGGPHVIVWNTRQNADGSIVVTGIQDQFFAYDARFAGGVNVATGDLDGDGKAEIITGAGPGGGPHVRIWKEINGHFQVVNEFFAFAPTFRGGVSVASGQGYNTEEQVRYLTNEAYGFGSDSTPFEVPPGSTSINGIPLAGLAYTVPAGGTDPFFNPYGAPGTPITVPNGAQGFFDSDNNPLTYFTIAAGSDQYLSANLLNTYGNIALRPDINVPAPNPNGIGQIVTANWTTMDPNLPPGFTPGVEYGPFVRVAVTADGKDIIARLTLPPDQVTFKNDLVVGAGPGGGPDVKVYDFSTTANGVLHNNGVGKEFFAFNANFRGGVNVGIGNVIEDQDANSLTPGRTDFTQTPPVFIVDNTGDSGTQVFNTVPYATELNRRDQPDVICCMASQGSDVVVFADASPEVADPTNPLSDPAPARRTSLSQLNLQKFTLDETTTINPNAPLNGYNGFSTVNTFHRAVDNSANFTGGVNFTVGALNFQGSASTVNIGTGVIGGGGAITINPVLGQDIFAAGPTPAGQANRGSLVNIFNQLSPQSPVQPNPQAPDAYQPYDSFQGFPAIPQARGASVAFGFGVLAEPGLDVNYVPNVGGTITPVSVTSVASPILIN